MPRSKLLVSEEEVRQQWIKRVATVGKAQARYLWILLIVGLFFWALHSSLSLGESEADPTVIAPVIGLELSSATIWAAGPSVIFLLIIIIWGTLRAFRTAQEALKLDRDTGASEPYDAAPNAIDFAVYTSPESPYWVRALLWFTYPAFLTVFWVEGAVIWLGVDESSIQILGKPFFLWLGAILGVASGLVVLAFYWKRIVRIRSDRRKKEGAAAQTVDAA